MSLDALARTAYNEDHEAFRQTVRQFMLKEVAPNAAKWDDDGIVPKSLWPKAGELGLLCPTVPEEYGGLGLDFGYNAIVDEESAYYGEVATGFSLQSDIVANYIISYGSEEQKKQWLPKLVSGETITAIAMTEPGTGSDLQGMRTTAKKDGNHYVINGSKTYITNGQNADLILVCAKTDTEIQPAWKGVSIILVEAEREGFKRGRNLDKIGQDAADTSELFFEDVRVPMTNCLGEEGKGFIYLMSELPQERLSIAVSAQAAAQKAFDDTVAFTRDRKAFGKPILDFQNSRFVLADLKAKLQVGWAHLDWALTRHLKRELTPAIQDKIMQLGIPGLDFVTVYYYDSQAFLVPRKLGKKSAKDLSGNSICVQSGTTTAENAEEYFRLNKMTYSPVSFDKLEDMRTAFFAGRCDALTADRSAVYAARASYAATPSDFLVLPESPSREPLGLIIKQGDTAFREVVRWSLFAMVEAEELGVRASNVDEMLSSENARIKRLLGATPGMGKALGVDDRWAYTIVKQVGNYGEVYERNVGTGSNLRIPRSLNALASQGGMQYAPPMR